MKIRNIRAREIFDSRAIPTIECTLFLSDGMMVTSSVPSGISRGTYEAVELRDGGDRLRGLGVSKSVRIIEDIIAPILIDRIPDVVTFDLELLELDKTDNKSHLGANTILAISIAVCRAQAYQEGLELYEFIAHICQYETVALPHPMFNFLEGGLHADNQFPIQELLIVPMKEHSFRDAMETGISIFHSLGHILKKKGKSTGVGYEGGFIPFFNNEYEAFDILMEAIDTAGKSGNVMISIDMAASHFYDSKTGLYTWAGTNISSYELVEWYNLLIKRYPIYSIEDGLEESDWNGWSMMNQEIGSQVILVGDDLFATNSQRIWHGIENECAAAVLIKPNQIGTVTETLQAAQLCKDNEIDSIVSHRSGETIDSFIADLAVGISADHIKTGGCSRGERMAKYNRLLVIEENLTSP